VTSGVETNHSTLSKIIGLTWQQLSHEERQRWHAKAKIEQEEHKRRYPMYSFRPVHNRRGGGHAGHGGTGGAPYHTEKRRLREIGPKDQKRCEKIAELLACGKKGQELEAAIKEFDKHHVPKIVTRFEEPITAESFGSGAGSSPVERGPSPAVSTRSCSSGSGRWRSTTPSSQGRPNTSQSAISFFSPPSPLEVEAHAIDSFVPTATSSTSPLSFDHVHSFFHNSPSPSFVSPFILFFGQTANDLLPKKEMDNFAFSIRQASPTNDNGYQDHLAPVVVGVGNHFDTSLAGNGDASLLVCGGSQVYTHNHLDHHAHTQVEHCQWPGVRPCSPFSTNSTGSLPTTPISLSCGDQMAAGLGSGYDPVTQNQAAYPASGFGEDVGHAHEREYDYISLSTSASRRSSDNTNNDLNNNAGCFVSNYPQTYQVQSYTPQLSLSLPPSMPMPVQIPVSVPDYLPSKQLNDDVYATNADSSELDECHVQLRRTSHHEPEHSREDMEFAMFMASLPSYQL